VKEKVLGILKENSARYVSGEHISEALGVSRAAIWKHIKDLKKEGYVIIASSKKGYSLVSVPDVLNSYEIIYNLKTGIIGSNIIYREEIDSTNNYAKKIASEGCKDGTVVVAECQTAGRGRLGRMWDSARNKGIYMSIVLRPEVAPEDVQIITIAASIAVAEAIRDITGMEAAIKWPNDIILDGKKVCGILTEMSSEMEKVNFLVVGIGLNVNHSREDFPEELANTATSLRIYAEQNSTGTAPAELDFRLNRSSLVKAVLTEMENVYCMVNNGNTDEVVRQWKEYSVTLGKEVLITSKSAEYRGFAKDITKDGRLIVDCSDGVTREVMSGEVKVRGLLGYT